jgi:Fe-S-cluster containining protein
MKQIRNTLVKIAQKDDTCNLSSLKQEICNTYHVSERTANTYIQELVNLGIAKVRDNWIWHTNENEIRQIFEETKMDIEVIKV